MLSLALLRLVANEVNALKPGAMKRLLLALVLACLASLGAYLLVLHLVDVNTIDEEQGRLRRPAGADVAVLHRLNRTGATGGFDYDIHLPNAKEDSRGKRGPKVWSSYRVEPARMAWRGRDTLEVFVQKDTYNWGKRGSIDEGRAKGMRVVTVWVPVRDSTAGP